MKLIQKYKFATRIYELMEDGVKHKYKRFFTKNEEIISFEEIPENRLTITISPRKSFFGALIITIIALFIFASYFFTKHKTDEIETTLFYLSISLVFWIYFWLNYVSLRVLGNDNIHLFFFEKSPSKESVESFLDLIIEKRNDYLEEKYNDNIYNYDTSGSSISTEIFKLFKLKEQNIISDEEYIQLKNELTKGSSTIKNSLGFKLDD
ncbi:MAG: hypothetical protein Q8934_21745 [Bacillota bacterium]|nr:hypothetical protein [Bacillota bacterium]